MRAATAHSTDPDTSRAVADAYTALVRELGGPPDWLLIQSSVHHDVVALQRAAAATGVRAIHGGSSCLGVMTRAGVHGDHGVGLFGLRDEHGGFGVGLAPLGDDPAAAAGLALQRAIDDAGRAGEVPALVWLTAAPGHEEACIAGIEAVVGRDVPVVGGSTADDAVAGGWYQFTRDARDTGGIVVTALYPTTSVTSAFQSGYSPTEHVGKVTRADRRELHAIDGRPAAEVYDEWTGGAIRAVLPAGGSVLATTTLWPIGRRVGDVGGVPYYRLAHPESVAPGGVLRLFADFAEGDELVLMHGSVDGLLARAGRVASDALALARLAPADVAGALVIFCAGCMLTVRDQLDQVVAGLQGALGPAPFIGCFTFGEQGCFLGGENRHGNLMISVTVFAKD